MSGLLDEAGNHKVCQDDPFRQLARTVRSASLPRSWSKHTYNVSYDMHAGVVANQTAGPAVCLSFVVGGVCAMLSSLVYSEVSF
jgi:hypothetical protein